MGYMEANVGIISLWNVIKTDVHAWLEMEISILFLLLFELQN
jgi:hypothetical protein